MLTIRNFRPRDLRRILQIEAECFAVNAWPAELFRAYAKRDPEMFFVAKIGFHIAGYCVTWVDLARAEFDSLAVAPRYQGRGVARRLIGKTLAELEKQGVKTVALAVRKDNIHAIQLYRSLGFVRIKTIRGYYEDGSAAWRMRLRLS